jgi:NADH-quinone oxidoreductase subunit L
VFHAGQAAAEGAASNPIEWLLLAVSALVALGGAYTAYYVYIVNKEIPTQVREALGWFTKLVENKYYVDEIYNAVIVNPLRDLGGWFAGTVDKSGLDGAVNGIAGITGWLGSQARRLQTGLVGLYALSILFGAVALVAWLVIR